MPKLSILSINSYSDLQKNQKEILKRINSIPNGGNLFLLHPFSMFDDINVILSEKVKTHILEKEPVLVHLSPLRYKTLKKSKCNQNYNIIVKGLFKFKGGEK